MPEDLGRDAWTELGFAGKWSRDWDWEWGWRSGWYLASNPSWVRLPQEVRDA